MDILIRTQASGDVILTVPLALTTGAPDTGATLTVKAINPDGTENTTFTQPTITEVIATSGVYRLTFAAAAATPLFTSVNQNNPYTLLVKSGTAGSTQYRHVRIYCTDRLPGQYGLTTDVTSATTTLQGNITSAVTPLALDSTVAKATALTTVAGTMALDATVAKATAITTLSGIVALDATVAKSATVALDATVAKAANVITLQNDMTFVKKTIKNRKTLSAVGSVYSLNIFDDDDSTPILTKVIKDVSGADITTLAVGTIAKELKTSV